MEAGDREDFHRLKDVSVPEQRELVTEQALYDAGLSSVLHLGTSWSVGRPLSFLSVFRLAQTLR